MSSIQIEICIDNDAFAVDLAGELRTIFAAIAVFAAARELKLGTLADAGTLTLMDSNGNSVGKAITSDAFDQQPTTHTCAECGSADVEVCLPAWFKARGYDLEYVEVDGEAEELNTHCNACEENRPLNVAQDGEEAKTISGRW